MQGVGLVREADIRNFQQGAGVELDVEVVRDLFN